MNRIKKLFLYLPFISLVVLLIYITIIPEGIKNNYPQIGSIIIILFLGSLASIVLWLILSGVWSVISSNSRNVENILDEEFVREKTPSDAQIRKNYRLIYPIVFQDHYTSFMKILDQVKNSKKDYLEITQTYEHFVFVDNEKYIDKIEPFFFEAYAVQNGFMLSFYENEIAEDDYLRIYNFVKDKVNIEISDIEDVLSERNHKDGFDIIIKQALKTQEQLNPLNLSLCIYNTEFLYHVFIASQNDYRKISDLKYPEILDLNSFNNEVE